MKILLIEDDEALISVLTRSLTAQHYIVDAVKDGEMGWNYGSTFEYDLIMLDIVLPKLDGITLCRRFRAEGFTTPILLLTAQDNSAAKVQGLDAGADDYVVKPFDQAELIARIRALLRRSCSNPFPLLTCGDLLLDPSTCEVRYGERALTLTTKEYELLELLLRDSQHVLSTNEILDRLWSSEEFPSEATVRSHIRRLRRKLVEAGAPSDFIATLHGRGYYLKALNVESTSPEASNFASDASSAKASGDVFGTASSLSRIATSTADAQQQYLAFLNDTWTTTKPKVLAQITTLLQAAADLQINLLDAQQQVQTQQAAHKLVGTLGIFGLNKAMHLARQLEQWLGSREPLQSKQAPLIQTLVTALRQEIDDTELIQSPPGGSSPLLLAVSEDLKFNESLAAAAANRGIRINLATQDAALNWATAESAKNGKGQQPDVVLFRFASTPSGLAEASASSLQAKNLEMLQTFTRHYPTLPILVMAEGTELSDRLEVMRWGGKLFLDPSALPEQVLSSAIRLLRGSGLPDRVMIVDDDQDWLRMLPTLLKPWGFKVTTLADPQQFLTVLQAVAPDVLVLDVNMPNVSGFELCQILRSDPLWQRLPVLFLSVLTDTASQNQAFTVGADDYLCKPIRGVELANRILCRLQRVRAWAS